MALIVEKISKPGGVQEVFVYEQDKPEEKHLACILDRQKRLVKFRPRQPILKLNAISIEGFDRLPPEFSEKGSIKSGLGYYLNKKFDGRQVSSLVDRQR